MCVDPHEIIGNNWCDGSSMDGHQACQWYSVGIWGRIVAPLNINVWGIHSYRQHRLLDEHVFQVSTYFNESRILVTEECRSPFPPLEGFIPPTSLPILVSDPRRISCTTYIKRPRIQQHHVLLQFPGVVIAIPVLAIVNIITRYRWLDYAYVGTREQTTRTGRGV